MDPDEKQIRSDTQQGTARSSKRVLIADRERFSSLIAKMLPADQFLTETAVDGLQAIRSIRKHVPDLLLIEQSLQGGGLRLAELVGMNPKYRQIQVMLMSATPSPEGIIRARNAGAGAYLAKPFRPSQLRSRIEAMFAVQAPPPVGDPGEDRPEGTPEAEPEAESQENGTRQDIRDRVKKIDGLPSFPSTHIEILKLAKSDEASSEDIAEKIKLDPSLLATVFKLVNSSYYGFTKKVDALKLAVTLLGVEEIANLVMAAQIFEKLGRYTGGAGFDLKAFWRHAVGTAFISRALAKKLQAETESAFLAGMLHDLGKVVLDRCFPEYYQQVIEQVRSENIPIVQAESDILGLTHADVGGQLATEWKFSAKYLNVILYHHAPGENRRFQRLTCLVHIADILCRKFGYGSGGDSVVPEIDPVAIDRFSLGSRGMGILMEAAEKDLQDADSFVSALAE